MKKMFVGAMVALMGLSLTAVTVEAEARRLGGGGSSGMSRSVPARQTPTNPPPQQQPGQTAPTSPAAAPATQGAAAAAAQAAPRRSWMGPIAGLAAGLGLAALASHFGFGEELANFMMLALLGVVLLAVIGFVMRRFAAKKAGGAHGMQYAAAGGPAVPPQAWQPDNAPLQRSHLADSDFGSGSAAATPLAAAAGAAALPADFDRVGFERAAKLIFIRMQAANDAGDLEDLRRFTTPEMFAAAKLDLQERRGASQQTDVVQLDAEVVDFAREDGRDVVSVRYHGLIREEEHAGAEPFDEIWHLVRPADGSREWAIAGIQQSA